FDFRLAAVIPYDNLLVRVKPLVNSEAGNHQDQESGGGPQPAQRGSESVDLGQNLRLLLLHVRFRFAKVELIVLLHGECATVNEEDNQDSRQNAPRYQ